MNKALYLLELKRNLKSFLIWSGVVLFITVFILSIFSTFAEMGDAMEVMMEGMPEAMIKAFGMSTDIYSNVVAYYATYYGMHIMILMGIFAITMGAGILSKEEREKTSEFLLTKPITRTEVINSKLAVYFTYLALLFILQSVAAYITMLNVSDGAIDVPSFFTLTSYGTMLTLMHGALGWFLSMIPKRGEAITGPLIGLVVGGFVFNALSKISADSEILGYFTPFHYADFNITAEGYSIEPWRAIIFLGIALSCHVGVYLHYNKKDLNG